VNAKPWATVELSVKDCNALSRAPKWPQPGPRIGTEPNVGARVESLAAAANATIACQVDIKARAELPTCRMKLPKWHCFLCRRSPVVRVVSRAC
jgi:hypothetical protein